VIATCTGTPRHRPRLLKEEAAHDTAMLRAAATTSLWRVGATGSQRFLSPDSAMCHFPLLAFVIDVATICHVPPLRDHTCRL